MGEGARPELWASTPKASFSCPQQLEDPIVIFMLFLCSYHSLSSPPSLAPLFSPKPRAIHDIPRTSATRELTAARPIPAP